MEEPNDEVGLFSSALRELCPQQECELGIVVIESEKVFVDILSLGTSNRETFLTLYKEFKKTGAAVREYTDNWPRKREELLQGFIATWKKSHVPETFYASGFKKFLIK